MIDKGADVLYAERFGVSDAAKERGKLAIGNVIDTQSKYPDTVVASALWNMEPTIDLAIKNVKDGKFKAEDYGKYSTMKYKGSELAPLGTFENKVPADAGEEGEGQGEGHRGRHVHRRGRGDRAQVVDVRSLPCCARLPRAWREARRAEEPRYSWAHFAVNRDCVTAARPPPLRHHQALRRAGGQRRHLARSRARRGAGAAGRERRRQEHAGEHPVRPLRGRRRLDRGLRPAAPARRPRTPRWPRASAWCTSTSRWPTTCRCSTTCCSAPRRCGSRSRAGARRARGSPTSRKQFGLTVDAGRAHRRSVGRRAPARRDPQGALPRRAHPDPRRADRGAHAAGVGSAVRDARDAGRRGLSIIFISHKLDEVLRGQPARGRAAPGQAGRDARRCGDEQGRAGRAHGRAPRRRARADGGTLESASPACCSRCASCAAGGKLKRAHFDVRRGEIFGIAGVSGNGQAQLADALCGLLAAGPWRDPHRRAARGRDPAGVRARSASRACPKTAARVGVIGDLAIWENAISERYREPRVLPHRMVATRRREGACAAHRRAVRRALLRASTRRLARCPAATSRS